VSYIEGVDYWVRQRPFPCTTIYAWAVSLGDGTFDIWLNTRVSEAKRLSGLRHDLKHLEDNHFYRDDISLAEKENIAWGAADEEREACGEAPAISALLPGSLISVYRSNDLPEGVSFAFYAPSSKFIPRVKKGELLYCDDEQLRPGDIALFGWKGETICRQYNKDVYGITYLFSLDRKKPNDDIIIPSTCEKDLTCYGRIRLNRAAKLPEPALVRIFI
jgi:hypothetical protein